MHATSTLFTPPDSFPEELPYRGLTLMVVERGTGGPGYDDHVRVGAQTGPVGAIRFANVAFNPVAHHGAADLARYDTADLASLTVPPGHVTDESPTHALVPMLISVQELASAREPLSSW